jgi:hypothetical protein
MPTLNIIEYGNIDSDNNVGDLVAIQNIEFDESTPVLSAPFSYRTTSVRFAATANCWLKFTASGENDVSSENGIFLFSSNPQRFRVEPLQRISILQGEASAGTGGGDIDLSDAYQAEYTGDWLIEQAIKADLGSPLMLMSNATGGDSVALFDTNQNWTPEQWTNHTLWIEKLGELSKRKILGNSETVVGFTPPLGISTEATALIGAGTGPEGQIQVSLVDKGADGDNWKLHLISEEAGVSGSMTNVIGADVENKIITIFIDTNGLGEQQQLWAGSVQALLADHIPGHLTASNDFIAGYIALGTSETPIIYSFSGGIDGQSVQTGDRYWISRLEIEDLCRTEIESISIVAGAIETPLDGNHRTLVLSEDVDSGWTTPIDGDPSTQVFYSSIDIFPPVSGGPFSISIPAQWLCMGPLDEISLSASDEPISVTLRSWGSDNIAYVAVQGGYLL